MMGSSLRLQVHTSYHLSDSIDERENKVPICLEPVPIAPPNQIRVVTTIDSVPAWLQHELSCVLSISGMTFEQPGPFADEPEPASMSAIQSHHCGPDVFHP
jgi:hypothetical protein